MSARCGTPRHPNLFVYDLPPAYRVRGRNARANDGKNFTFSEYPVPMSLDWMYDVATIFYLRALSYSCHVTDPAKADLFYVPAYNTEMTPHPSSFCAEVRGSANHHTALYDRLVAQAGGALQERGGADHILLTPRPGAYYFETHPLCELDLLDPRFGSAARLSIEQTPPTSDLPPYGPFSYHSAPHFVSVPYPSWVRLPSSMRHGSRRGGRAAPAGGSWSESGGAADPIAPWRIRHPRLTQIAAVFGVGVGGGKPSSACVGVGGCTPVQHFRLRLREHCLERPGGCVYLGVLGANNLGARRAAWTAAGTSNYAFNEAAAALYWNSTFCLMPGGDSATRKATMDALLLGCIPVLFHQAQVRQYPWHWQGWVQQATVLLDYAKILENTTHPIDALLAISEAEVRAKQAAIAVHAHRMHWAYDDGGNNRQGEIDGADVETHADEDAFTITLRAVRERAADSQLVEDGRKTQQGDGKAKQAKLENFVNVTSEAGILEGQCPRSTGAGDAQSCHNMSAPWLPPRPLVRGNVGSINTCINLCVRCPRCRWISYSLMLQLCTWHHTCDPGVNGSRLDRRYEMWTYRSLRVRTDEAAPQLLASFTIPPRSRPVA